MDFLKSNQQKVTKKRKRNDSSSSSSSNSVTKKRLPEDFLVSSTTRLEYASDSSNHSVTSNVKNLQSASVDLEVANPRLNSSNVVKSKKIVFLNKARKLLRATRDKHRKKKLSRKSGALLEALDKVLSPCNDHGKFLGSMRALSWLKSLPGYEDLCLQVNQADSSSDDDDNPSTSRTVNHHSQSTTLISTSQSPPSKHKRRSTLTAPSTTSNKDPDIGCEPPLAKRQQRLPSIYQSQPDSVASSMYSSPLNELLAQEIDQTEITSSIGYSTDVEHDAVSEKTGESTTIPDSPNSLQNSEQSSSSNDSDDSSEIMSNHSCPHHSCEEDCENDSLEDELISNITSSYPEKFRHILPAPGERTPAECLRQQSSNDANTIDEQKISPFDDYVNSIYDCMTPAAEADPPRQCPLPALSWANAHDVWHTMCKKDEEDTCLRDAGMLERHPGLAPRMRAILLDWLIEVCEVYKLHRETYYLAVDYLDRYLTSKHKVQKTHLQLIGITCLFVAAKVEEIYPPKIGEFAYVTDGACQEADILHNEILLLQALDWDINPITPMGWLGVYMQLNVNNRTPKILPPKNSMQENKPNETENCKEGIDEGFIYPQFSGFEFVQTAQLLDLCSLDVGVAHFPYSVLAAAAISHTFNRETALRCSALDWKTIQPCARWMEPFFVVISSEADNLYMMEQNEQVPSKFGLGHICSNITTDDSHIIQTHTITMQMFDRVTQMQEQLLSMTKAIKPEASPATGLICPEGLLTPPASSRKPLDVLDEDHTKTTVKSTVSVSATANTTTKIIMPVNKANNQLNKLKAASTVHQTLVANAKKKTT